MFVAGMMGDVPISGVQAYLAGLTFALAASPCSTPVLATLLGYVAASKVSWFLLILKPIA